MKNFPRFVAFAMALAGGSAFAQTSDLAEKGPFASRHFARNVGSAVQPRAERVPSFAQSPGLLFEGQESNELIVLLDYNQKSRLNGLLPQAGLSSASPAAVERAVVRAINERGRELSLALGGAVHARFLIDDERIPDEARAAAQSANLPREKLDRYIILRYDSVALAQAAYRAFSREASVAAVHKNGKSKLSYTPNDPYFSPASGGAYSQYQWGLHAMSFPSAWDTTRGHAYVGVLDAAYAGDTMATAQPTIHPDLTWNYRSQFSPGAVWWAYDNNLQTYNNHTIHVSGIIAARSNNGSFFPDPSRPSGGVTGGCINCSFATFTFLNNTVFAPYSAGAANAAMVDSAQINIVVKAAEMGMQILNWSGSQSTAYSCPGSNPMCAALDFANERSMLIVESAGNIPASGTLSPLNFASVYNNILPVAGTEVAVPGPSIPGSLWFGGSDGVTTFGSVDASVNGVVAPAKNVISTLLPGTDYYPGPIFACGDTASAPDGSGTRYASGYGDGVGTCTGTSMAAPHVSALAGLVLSVNPRISASQARNYIWQSGNLSASPSAALGYGLPNAANAVAAVLASNPTKLAPLFSFYSPGRTDSFYTTVPQMANAALDSTLRPRVTHPTNPNFGPYSSAYGSSLGTYWTFPRNPFTTGAGTTPVAEVWIFTAFQNPKSASVPLAPLYRFSWKCGDYSPYPSSVCWTNPYHMDVSYGLESEIAYMQYLGYKVDGLEGYIYPKELPQPTGTVKLMRKYNSSRDDVAIFPDTKLSLMFYTHQYQFDVNGTDWLGYVYLNVNGSVPAIQ